jgi:hypothetical protein
MIPILARLAKEIFAIPATSAPSERIFSSTGLMIMESRMLLNTNCAEELIFCQQNYRRVASLKFRLDKTAYVEEEKKKKLHEGKMIKTFRNCKMMCIQCTRVTKVDWFNAAN